MHTRTDPHRTRAFAVGAAAKRGALAALAEARRRALENGVDELEAPVSLEHLGRPEHIAERYFGRCHALVAIADQLFQQLSDEEAVDWAERVVQATPVGVDLRPAIDRFFAAFLGDPELGLAHWLAPEQRPAAARMAALYARRVAGDEPGRSEWMAARLEADDFQRTSAGEAIWKAGYYALERHASGDDDAARQAGWQAELAVGAGLRAAFHADREALGAAEDAYWRACRRAEAYADGLGVLLIRALRDVEPKR